MCFINDILHRNLFCGIAYGYMNLCVLRHIYGTTLGLPKVVYIHRFCAFELQTLMRSHYKIGRNYGSSADDVRSVAHR